MKKIASKIANRFFKYQLDKIVNLSDYKNSKTNSIEKIGQLKTASDLVNAGGNLHHAVFAEAQNLLSVIIEELMDLPELDKHNEIILNAQEEYMPSWPPMSPISVSYFSTWSFFDVKVGLDKESYFSCVRDLGALLGVDPRFMHLWSLIEQSRLGIYKVLYPIDDKVMLEEVFTKKQYMSFTPNKLSINPGELWLIRLFPKAHDGFEYRVIFTSPYILLSSQQQWEVFFDRNITGIRETSIATKNYENFMSNGLNPLYWMEFIMQGYVSYTDTTISLAGLPDIGSSRPVFFESNLLPERKAT